MFEATQATQVAVFSPGGLSDVQLRDAVVEFNVKRGWRKLTS